jgi:hypothetical protein
LSYDNETVKRDLEVTSARGWRRLLSRRALVPLALVAIATPVVLVARAGDDSRTSNVLTIVLLTVMAALILFVVVNYGLQFAGFDGEASEIAEHLAVDPDQQRLLARWLGRARWARFVGGFCGCLVWVLGTQMHGDLLLVGTGGIAVGAMLAELHHIRPSVGPRTARLDVRSVGDYLMRQDARRMIGAAIAATAVAVAGLVADDVRAATWWGLGAVGALAVARVAQRRVATRPRPAVSDKLTRADDLARELAIGRGLARPATFFALAMVARGCYSLMPAIGQVARLFGAAAWLYSLYLWWHNRRLGLDFLLTERRDSVLV